MHRLFFILYLFFTIPAFAANTENWPAPNPLPNVNSSMLSAGYWISRHPDPDKLVMTKEQIKDFNRHIQDDLKLTKDIFYLIDHFQTESLLDVLKKDLQSFVDHGYYTSKGDRNDNALMDKIKNNMHLSGLVLGVAPRYGLVTHLTDLRILPTKDGLYTQRGDLDFDEIQNSVLDVGTPVAIIHQSLDKKWFYVLSSLSDGWVRVSDIAIADQKIVKNFANPKNMVVGLSPRADLFSDQGMSQQYDVIRMGAKLPLLEETEDYWLVQIPTRNKEGLLQFVEGYIPKYQAHHGYLPYTARTIYIQAFMMLDKIYGWGDMNGGQDCSRFIQMVFATVGIELPRDSKNQAQVKEAIQVFDDKQLEGERLSALRSAKGAITLLPMKGHIMLFLGANEGTFYVIHATSGYTKKIEEKNVKFSINRVVLSDLSLGEGGPKGSLLRRLTKIIEVS